MNTDDGNKQLRTENDPIRLHSREATSSVKSKMLKLKQEALEVPFSKKISKELFAIQAKMHNFRIRF